MILKGNTNFYYNSYKSNLEIDKMLNNPNLTASIWVGGGAGDGSENDKNIHDRMITGVLTSDLGISLGNEWVSLIPLNSIPIASDIASGVGALLGAFAGASQMSLESLYMTSASWRNCQMPKFPVSLTFVNYDPSMNCFGELLELSKGALPPDRGYNTAHAGKLEGLAEIPSKIGNWVAERVENSEILGEYFNKKQEYANSIKKAFNQIGQEAPLGYGLEPDGSEDGTFFKPKPHTTFQLRIGNWFHAKDLLIDTYSMNISKETLRDGKPIYSTVNIVFRPYRQISWQEFAEYFLMRPDFIETQLISQASKVANAAQQGGGQ